VETLPPVFHQWRDFRLLVCLLQRQLLRCSFWRTLWTL